MTTDTDLNKILQTVRDFMRDEVYPLETTLLREGFRALLPALAEKRQTAKERGLWTPHLPREFGGLGLSLSEFARVSEELGRSPLGHYLLNCNAPDIGNMEVLLKYGTQAQKEKYLRPLARGEIRSCFAMTEPEHAGSNPVWLSTTAVKDGNDYVINGHKWFASAADGAAFAVVMAVTNADAERPHQRASQIIAPTGTPGFRRVRNISMMGDAGSDFLSHAEIVFEDCRVPQSNLLGAEGQGFVLAQERLGPGRIHHCMRWIGICERAFDMMCEHAAKREVAPGKPLAGRQIVQHWIAESRAEIHASRLMVLDAAQKIDREGAHAARVEISLIKFFVAGVLQRVLDRAIQTHGALGVTDDTLLSFWYRHERAARIYDGPDEVHKTVVARHALRKYGVDVSL
ncbi:MAG: acyl-CoA dehydrogenase family protein [Chloroflexi bacterium]|nr:acyl-CoA dehydrogenase family protein [Chloroflexota bacterium]